MQKTLRLETGTRVEIWAQGPGCLRITIGAQTVWQVPAFPSHPAFFRYHHRESCDITIEWDSSAAIHWAYSYVPGEVEGAGITVWEFEVDDIIFRTGAEIAAWMRADPGRPTLHFSPIRQWMNDPNGLCKVGDTWHIFYQFHPGGTDWGPMHWGHATSKDLFNWTHMPVFLHPEQDLWQLGATGGAFSGNAFQDRDGSRMFFYTERLPAYDLFSGYREIQKIAHPGPGFVQAKSLITVIEERPKGVAHDFRDPKVWWDDAAGAYRMVLGASLEGDPAVLLYASDDLRSWAYLGPLYRAPSRFRVEGARAVECPDFFQLGGKWVLVMGFVGHTDPTSGRHNLLFALVGEFNDDCFVPDSEELQLLDFGTDFYAMQSFEADGRQIAFAWLFNWEDRKPLGSSYSGEMSLPRELSLSADGRLCMLPVSELDTAWPASPARAAAGVITQGAPFELQLTGPLNGTVIRATQSGSTSFEITVSDDVLSVLLPQDDGGIFYRVDIDGAQDVRVFHDRGIIEIFAKGGTICGTRRNYHNTAPDKLDVTTNANQAFAERCVPGGTGVIQAEKLEKRKQWKRGLN
ncbi:glycoside hydrolase family 32 protein [Limimaricola sp. AA108-03]|uniref:glycoside hydrolase family 32 protein n=1 Tax=Limimaricola sp. AA108-03 TaxID=3425945 RepID=UPI003D7797C3